MVQLQHLLHAVAQLVHLVVQPLVVFDQRAVLVLAADQRLVQLLYFALVLLVLVPRLLLQRALTHQGCTSNSCTRCTLLEFTFSLSKMPSERSRRFPA